MQKHSAVLWKIWVNQPHFPFWSSLVISTATLFIFAPMILCFLLLVDSPTKPLNPGACTYWIIFSSWNNAIYLLSRIVVLQNLHYQVSAFGKLTSPPSCTSKETPIWKFWPPQEMPRCMWHSIENPVGMTSFDMSFGIALWACTFDQTNLSTRLPVTPNLGLFSASLTQTL